MKINITQKKLSIFIFVLSFLLVVTLLPDSLAASKVHEIYNFEDLFNFAELSRQDGYQDHTYILQNDITITSENQATIESSSYKYLSYGSSDNPFVGTFDGNGYTIYNLTYDKSISGNKYDTGLISQTGTGAVIKDLTIADDYMFKLVMSHKRICKHLLEMLLGIRIRDLKEPETEKAMKHGYESKGIRLDVYVEDDLNTVYDIEMQVRHYPEITLGRRTRYYQSTIDFGALHAGVRYDKLKKSIIIFICPFQLFAGNRHIYTFQSISREDTSILLDDGTVKVFLSTKGTLEDVPTEIKNFLDFVDGLPVQDAFVDEIRNLITALKRTEKEKVDYMTFQMRIDEERDEALFPVS